MKRGTPDHPKLLKLCALLNVPKYQAVGILEMLWHFTAKYAPQGDIGKFTDKAIAKAVEWERPSGTRGVGPECRLSAALVAAGWLDECPCHRLVVHDWADHADQTVKRFLAGRKLAFIQHGTSKNLASASLPLPVPLPIPEPAVVERKASVVEPGATDPPLSTDRPTDPNLETDSGLVPIGKLLAVDEQPLPANGEIQHIRDAIATYFPEPDEVILGKIVQACQAADPKIRDEEIAIWAQAIMPDEKAHRPRGPAWWTKALPDFIRRNQRDVDLLRALIDGRLPQSQGQAVLCEGRIGEQLRKALRIWLATAIQPKASEVLQNAGAA